MRDEFVVGMYVYIRNNNNWVSTVQSQQHSKTLFSEEEEFCRLKSSTCQSTVAEKSIIYVNYSCLRRRINVCLFTVASHGSSRGRGQDDYVLLSDGVSSNIRSVCSKQNMEQYGSLFCTDKLVCPVATASNWVECQVRGTFVDPTDHSATYCASRTRDELATRSGMREYTDVVAYRLPIVHDLDLKVQKCVKNFTT